MYQINKEHKISLFELISSDISSENGAATEMKKKKKLSYDLGQEHFIEQLVLSKLPCANTKNNTAKIGMVPMINVSGLLR
jgi:hypothetical protein